MILRITTTDVYIERRAATSTPAFREDSDARK